MFKTKSLVLYKNQPALLQEVSTDKYTILYCTALPSPGGKPAQFTTQKVREKDIELLFETTSGEKTLLVQLLQVTEDAKAMQERIEPIYELLSEDEDSFTTPVSFADLQDYTDVKTAQDSWLLYKALKNTLFFTEQAPLSFMLQTKEVIARQEEKNRAKEAELENRSAFIQRLKAKKLNLPADAQLMQDVEALALGQSDKSKTMKEAGFTETPEKAHKLLLDTGVWTVTKNPYPTRWGLSTQSATQRLAPPPEEERITLEQEAYAIDNQWSTDPDDAIAFDGQYVWVHIADPASSVYPDSPIDIAARHRGATLYIPEGAVRMLAEDSLEDYALGLTPLSRALSFCIELDENGAVLSCKVLKTLVKVKRYTYEEADIQKDSPQLAPLYAIARRNEQRRLKAGAVSITLPEVHISVTDGIVNISPALSWESNNVVREFMLLAGEAVAKFAFKNGIPFPFVSQEKPDLPTNILDGYAGQYQLRRCMRSRSLGVTPMQHAGLGLGMYTQVTSPLRRYSDLVAHQQLRAFIDGRPLLNKDTMLERIAAGDAAAGASVKAERKSNLHWTLVYLTQNPQWEGDAVVVELKGKQALCLIPSLAQETLLTPSRTVALNDTIKVRAGNIDIPTLSVNFISL
ncbi:MAG: RNB domain-containing ribonuclease [Candidatus Treponema excrementipullorum]|uniref:RNB domain-containing ribonuclease n=1 Tax=Candidatus Treponema excrementipullorum TaxID=2838768 RepID=A0A9E2NYD9_9SPIR|nr:RNB domain-containing ribonuclease [Candidatus Treponema excrementipullorum]